MLISKIYERLSDQFESRVLVSREPAVVEDVYFISRENMQKLNSRCMYVLQASQLDLYCAALIDCHVVLVEDVNASSEKLKQLMKTVCSLIIVKNTCIFSVFNAVKTIYQSQYVFYKQSHQLYEGLVTKSSLLDVMEIGEKLLNNPIIVIDESFKVIQYTKRLHLTDEIWARNVAKGFCSYEFITEVNKLKALANSPDSHIPFSIECHANKIKKWVSKLYINKELKGYVIVPECYTPVTSEQLKLLGELAQIISFHLNHHAESSMAISYGMLEEKLFVDLVANTIHSKDELESRLQASKLTLLTYKRLIAIKAKDSTKRAKCSEDIQNQIRLLLPNSKQFIYKKDLYVLLSDKEKSPAKWEKLCSNVSSLLERHHLHGMVSDIFTDLYDLSIQYKQLEKGFELVSLLDKQSSLFFYNDLKFYHLLDDFVDKDKLLSYCHPAILKLKEYDDKNKTDYYNTLFMYLLHNQNIHDTADMLYIHRNTLKYRLNKILELSQLNLKEGEVIFQIAYSYMILNYIRKKEMQRGDGSRASFES
ncbi:hypothetical protein EJF36_02030 [Bacillus sp. HMF5848]|uniref:PucR family transcriptional regulator n=1 Tax=Bacillus sp. HMF5848 TaxID=2495421 RepID=UPI000F77F35D|nr:helix-turn-helix domain-containing protein [Bacillus sp. HMF5848]RSK25768.1 hypothetical protein EJF36_02030 [Bacillus sp. HMF5848]